jgi:transcriptional regulator with XRE-family HTH domain
MDKQLGEFIRSHRERIKPKDVGLHDIGIRRTPGLRREELAQLCAVSATWLTWLEQGRPVSASAKVLNRLAEVMKLTPAERNYLFKLADKLDPREPVSAQPAIQLDHIVDAITVPAYILDRQWNAVAWNQAATELFTGWLVGKKGASPRHPNLLAYMFMTQGARTLIADWPDRAQRLVAEFRADCGKQADQEPLAGMIASLARASASFRDLWNAQHVVSRDGGVRQFIHPRKGALQFEQASFNLAAGYGYKLVMLTPQ